MNNDKFTINVSDITKIYKLYNKPMDRLKESFHPLKKIYHRDFYALKNVSFVAQKGESIGIIGKNGSGKSTLLQIVTGVLTPSTGLVEVRGKVSALLELGAGFNPELTGIENVYFKSSLLGFSAVEIDERMDDILDFADIGEFVFQPVKMYSSGMFVRLAFAVAINVDPDVLIIDEALSVGDFRFQQKCLRKIREFRERGKTILFVSHSTHSVVEFCNKAIWLRDGQIAAMGDSKKVCQKYMAYVSLGDEKNIAARPCLITEKKRNKIGVSPTCLSGNEIDWEDVDNSDFNKNISFGSGAATIQHMCLCFKTNGKKIKVFEGGERVVLYLRIKVNEDITQTIVGFHLCDARGVHVLGLNTITTGVDLGSFKQGEVMIVAFEFGFPYLHIGEYSFTPAIASGTQLMNTKHHWVNDAYLIKIESSDDAQKLGHYFAIKNDVVVNCNILS